MVIALQVAAITLSTAVLWAVDSMAQPRFPDADIPPSSRRTYQQSFCHVVILVYVVIYYIFLLTWTSAHVPSAWSEVWSGSCYHPLSFAVIGRLMAAAVASYALAAFVFRRRTLPSARLPDCILAATEVVCVTSTMLAAPIY